MQNIGDRLKDFRKAKNLTQQELGNVLNVSKQAIANIESKHNNPSIEVVSKLIEIFNLNANWLLIGQGSMFVALQSKDFKAEVLDEVNKVLEKYGFKK